MSKQIGGNPPTPQLPGGKYNRVYRLGTVLGLRVTAETSAFVGGIVLWAMLAVVGRSLLGLTGPDVVVGGALTVLLHYGSEFVHQMGHALAAANTGHPMSGMHFWLLLGRSVYPAGEPKLPAAIHLRRAKGGPIASAIASGVLGVLALLMAPVGGMVWAILVFLFLDNLLVFTIGSLLPLGFTDGSTILKYRQQKQK